jgi:hypothetical protein
MVVTQQARKSIQDPSNQPEEEKPNVAKKNKNKKKHQANL